MTNPKPRLSENTDYSTGRRTVSSDIDVPDRRPAEPHAIRVQAREHSTNQWSVSVVHGPHDEKDASGSYYRHMSQTQFSGPLGKLRPHLNKSANEAWKGLRDARG